MAHRFSLGFPAPAKSSKIDARFTEESMRNLRLSRSNQCRGDLVVLICEQPASGYEPPGRTVSDAAEVCLHQDLHYDDNYEDLYYVTSS